MYAPSGAWLNALPITSLGLRMDDTTIRISMGLRLGIPLCRNHICQHCGAEVSQFATHGLSCKRSAGRHYRHSAINDIIHRALVAAHVPSRLEPSGLYRSDGKRPDGITTVPWKCGQLLVWDATCPDTYAPSYSTIAAQQAGAVGQQAEDKKAQKYKQLTPLFHSCGNRDIRSVWSKNSQFPKRAGTSVEASVGRGELFPLSCPKACRLPFREAIQLQ